MAVTQFFDPFGTQQRARDLDSQISARDTRTALDLFSMQQAMDAKRNQMAYLQEISAPKNRQPAQAGQPGVQGQQQDQQPKPGAADMILNEVQELDRRAALAGKYNLAGEVDKLTKLREQAMGRYSLAMQREQSERDRQDKVQTERIKTIGNFAGAANRILTDNTMQPADKRQSLEEMEDELRRDSPEAYKVLSKGAPQIDWANPRTWNQMQALQERAISPEKRAELALTKQSRDEQKRRDDIMEKKTDAQIAALRERGKSDGAHLPVGTEWIDQNDHSKGARKIQIVGDEKVLQSVQKDLNQDPLYKNYDRYSQAYTTAKGIAAKIHSNQPVTAADVQDLRAHYQNIIEGFRARQGGKYNQQEFARLNGTYQNIEKWLNSIGSGTPAVETKGVASEVIGTIANEYVNRTKDIVVTGLKAAANAEKRGGDPTNLRLKGDIGVLVNNGMASIKTDEEGQKWIGIKEGGEIRKYKLPEGAF